MQGQLKRLCEPNDKTNIIAACEWLTALLPELSKSTDETIKLVCVAPAPKNVFFPVEKTIVISQSWLIHADVQTVARLLAMGAKYIRKCRENNLFAILNLSPSATERWLRNYGTN